MMNVAKGTNECPQNIEAHIHIFSKYFKLWFKVEYLLVTISTPIDV